MNTSKVSALLHYMGRVRRRIGREIQPAQRFMQLGQTRTDRPSGAQRRHTLRWGGRYRFDAKATVWRLQTGPGLLRAAWQRVTGESPRTPRGRLTNPTALR